MTDRLVNWRAALEQRYPFEPAVIVDPHDVQRLDRELAARSMRYMNELRSAILAFEKRIHVVGDERGALWARVEGAFQGPDARAAQR